MSTLKVTHLQNENGTGPAMSIAVGGGVTFAGITTFHGALDLQTPTDLRVATGATIGGSTNTITASTNGEERVRITADGDVGIGTNNPARLLHLAGEGGANEVELRLDAMDGGERQITFTGSGSNTHIIRSTGTTDNSLVFIQGSNERLRINSSGKVGIGTDNPEGTIHVLASSNNQLVLESSDSIADIIGADTGGSTRIRSSGGQLTFYTGGDAISHNAANSSISATFNTSGNLEFPDGQGIDFSAVTSTAGGVTVGNCVLDDYEEGTWTPTAETGTIDFTSAKYTKIGNIVHLNAYIDTWSNITSDAVVQIQSLPYAGENTDGNVGSVMYRYIDDTDGIGGDMVVFMANGDSLRFYFQNSDGDSNYAALKHKDINGNTSSFRVQMTYRAA